jgi:hypothetical protein
VPSATEAVDRDTVTPDPVPSVPERAQTTRGVTVSHSDPLSTGREPGDLLASAETIFGPLSGTWANGHDSPPLPDYRPGPDDRADEATA